MTGIEGGRVGIRALRQQASAVLKRVQGGEIVEITDRGHPIARIVPLGSGPMDRLIAEGRATEGEGDLLTVAREHGLPRRSTGPVSPTQALAELRGDER